MINKNGPFNNKRAVVYLTKTIKIATELLTKKQQLNMKKEIDVKKTLTCAVCGATFNFFNDPHKEKLLAAEPILFCAVCGAPLEFLNDRDTKRLGSR